MATLQAVSVRATNSTLVGLHLDRSKHALTSEVMRKIDECEILSALLLLLK